MNLHFPFLLVCLLAFLTTSAQMDENKKKIDAAPKKKEKTVTPALKETQQKEVEIPRQDKLSVPQDSMMHKQVPSRNKPMKINEKDCPVVV